MLFLLYKIPLKSVLKHPINLNGTLHTLPLSRPQIKRSMRCGVKLTTAFYWKIFNLERTAQSEALGLCGLHAIGASAARQPLGPLSPCRAPTPSHGPGRYAERSPGSLALGMLLGEPARPERMENLIQLFLGLQASAPLSTHEAAGGGQSSRTPYGTAKGRDPLGMV